ncbi:MAG: hypothetical protein MUF54_14075 [Polyangiaceae bacterium]|nr:hypothetical protein [Polyangiaceae bacterium]
MIRGGNFNNNDNNLRAANRNDNNPDNHNHNIGFRCAKTGDTLAARGRPEGAGLRLGAA